MKSESTSTNSILVFGTYFPRDVFNKCGHYVEFSHFNGHFSPKTLVELRKIVHNFTVTLIIVCIVNAVKKIRLSLNITFRSKKCGNIRGTGNIARGV